MLQLLQEAVTDESISEITDRLESYSTSLQAREDFLLAQIETLNENDYEEGCVNNVDDDNDGKVDSEDSGCSNPMPSSYILTKSSMLLELSMITSF